MKHFIILFLIFCTVSATAQENTFADRINRMLDKHSGLKPSEVIFVQTDRDVYCAGEIVWFSVFVRNPSAVGPGSVSDNLVVALYNDAGEKVNEDKYKLVGGLCNGDFNLPQDSEPGRYVLVAYSGATLDANELFMRTIYVDDFNRSGLIVKAEDDQPVLRSGETNELLFSLADLAGKPFSGKLNYVLKDGKNELIEGKGKTDSDGMLRLKFELPDKSFDFPLELVLTDGKQPVYTAPYHVNTEKVNVVFAAEGGQLIAGLAQKVAFRVENSLGQQVPVEVAVIDKSSGTQLLQAGTISAGFGIFPLQAGTGEHYQLKIAEGPGKGQLFDLPGVVHHGVSLALTRTDNHFIYCSLQSAGLAGQNIHLIAFRGNQLIWGADFTIDGSLNLKIPRDGFPEGVCQLLVLDDELNKLAGRLLYVEKNGPMKVEAKPESESLAINTANKLTVELNVDSLAQQTGLVNISISPEVLIAEGSPAFDGWLKVNGWLQYPLADISRMAKEGTLNEQSVNYLLIGNELKNNTWDVVKTAQTGKKQAEGITRARLEDRIPEQVDRFLNVTAFLRKPDFTPAFFLANEDLFKKVRPKNPAAVNRDQYKEYLASGNSILDVIKMIKPYNLDGDKIIFPGGATSFLFQDGALIVVDGQKLGTSASVLNSISPYDVESIEISTRPIDIQQYTGLNSVGLIDIKTKKGERVVETDDEPIKHYEGGNRVPRDFREEARDEKRLTLFWEPFADTSPVCEREIPGSNLPARYRVRILAVDEAGRLGTKELALEIK